jgi:hypothetical protein
VPQDNKKSKPLQFLIVLVN